METFFPSFSIDNICSLHILRLQKRWTLFWQNDEKSLQQISPDIKVNTDHTSIILGKKVNYEAQVGTQPIWNSSGATIYATLHYTLYKRKDIEDDSNRPLVF